MSFPAAESTTERSRSVTASPGAFATFRWATSMAVADRRNRKRLLVMAFGIALCMLVLLAVATIDPLISSVTAREAARQPTSGSSGPTFRFTQVATVVDGHELSGTLLSGPADATPPPGTTSFPADGELIVSPALADALSADGSGTLRTVLPGVVVGRIDPEVLVSAQEWTYYQGAAALVDRESATGWGRSEGGNPGTLAELNPDLWWVMITGVAVLMVPLLLFTTLAGRIGAARRDRRSALLRLLGASATQLRWIVAAEVALASVLGIALAATGYAAIRLLAPWLSLGGYAAQSSDIRPGPGAVAVIAVGVPMLAAISAVVGSRQAMVDPLGRVARPDSRPALAWRLALLTATAAATLYAMTGVNRSNYGANAHAMLEICVLVVLDVVCVAALVGPVTHALANLIGRGGPATRLARGRLLQSPVLSTRSAAALATVTATVIALMSLLSGRAELYGEAAAAADNVRPYTGQLGALSFDDWQRLDRDLRSIPGAQSVSLRSPLPMTAPAAKAELTTCDAIDQLAFGSVCRDGDVFGSIVAPVTATGDVFRVAGSGARWSPPVDSRNDVHGPEAGGIDLYLLTPAAVSEIPGITEIRSTAVAVWMPAGALAAAREATAWLGPQSAIVLNDSGAYSMYDSAYSWLSAALLAAAALVLLICALAQWLLSAEYVDDRRRSFALARASGVPTSVLGRAVIVGALFPVVVGTALATGIGALLAWEIKYLRAGDPVPLATGWVATSWAVAVLVTLVIASGAAAQLRRSTGPTALRTE